MDEEVYRLLKEKNTTDLLGWLAADRERFMFRDSNGISLLMLGYYFGNKELTSYILSHRSPVDIFEAVAADDMASVQKMLDTDAEALHSFSPDGFTPLGFAAYFGLARMTRYLLTKGADTEIPSRNSFSVYPLHSATASNSTEIVEILLKAGASPNVRQQQNITPLHSAAHNGNMKIARLLIDYGADTSSVTVDGKSALDMAAASGADEIINLLKSIA